MRLFLKPNDYNNSFFENKYRISRLDKKYILLTWVEGGTFDENKYLYGKTC